MSALKARPPKARAPAPRRRYHHGNLIEALLAATIEIIEERGVEHVSVREAAKRAGVSPAAPFRHFSTKTALMTAVAEQAMDRLTAAVETAVREVAGESPLVRFEAIGRAYLGWASANPTHFQIISSRSLIDFAGSKRLRCANEDIRRLMIDLLTEARKEGSLPSGLDFEQLVLSARAFVYGLARMSIDGHFPEWHTSEPPEAAMPKALALFLDLIKRASVAGEQTPSAYD
jgi:AcrR family transcriptional regulator